MNPDAVAQAATEERLRATRALLERQVLTPRDPELVVARRHREELAAILRDHLGATLTVTGDTAHLAKHVTLDGARPLRLAPRSANERSKPIDERRVLGQRGRLLVCLIAGVLERKTWSQAPLGAIAEEVLTHARSLDITLDWRSRADRTALTDAIEFLAGVGVVELRAGAAGQMDSDDEAFYDVHRRRLALLLGDPVRTAEAAGPEDLEPREQSGGDLAEAPPSRALVRALVEARPLRRRPRRGGSHYFIAQRGRLEAIAAQITGLAVERRREGTALVAGGRELTDRPFPARGHVKQLALLLLPELCARTGPRSRPRSSARSRVRCCSATPSTGRPGTRAIRKRSAARARPRSMCSPTCALSAAIPTEMPCERCRWPTATAPAIGRRAAAVQLELP